MTIQEKFGHVIRTLRKEKNISQEKLALNADIDRTYISDIEKGERNVSIETAKKLADCLQISLQNLFKEIENYGDIDWLH